MLRTLLCLEDGSDSASDIICSISTNPIPFSLKYNLEDIIYV